MIVLAAFAMFSWGASALQLGPHRGPISHLSLAAAPGTSWTVYHGNSLGTGVDTSGVTFSPPTPAWKSVVLDGHIYGEPLESAGRVFVATENDSVYALAANSGAILWSAHVGTPVTSGLPCGNIGPPLGITGTPVIDEGRAEIFVVADDQINGAISHHLIGLNIYSGAILLNQVVDPPGSFPPAQLQRTGLNLSNGNVVFGFGGNFGDCSTYHGWVVGVPENGGSPRDYEVASGPNQSRGAIWMGGAAPEVDATGNVWAASGNGSATSSTSAYDNSDSVFELGPGLNLEQIFAPSAWFTDNTNDADLGSTAPAILSNGTMLQVGKSHTGYLLNQARLGGIGGQLTSSSVCAGSEADGGLAVSGTDVFVPCHEGGTGGLQDVRTSPSPPGITVVWTAASGANGPPIIAGGLVWSIRGGTLFGIDPATGATVQQVSVGSESNPFATPSVGDGLLLAPSSTQVYAFVGSAGLPAPPTSPPPPPPNSSYWLVASDGGLFTFGGAGFYGSEGGKPLNAPIIGMAAARQDLGYWLAASDGGVFTFGSAAFLGSMGGKHLTKPVVGIATTPNGAGYWLVASDGGVFTFGNAGFYGSEGARPLNKPVVAIAPTPDGGGYWLVASDGGVFTFGNAAFYGSEGGKPLNAPVVGIGPGPRGGGYWLASSDGGVFTFGSAGFLGSKGGQALSAPVVGIAVANDGSGYWLAARDGGVFNFGGAIFNGSEGGAPLNQPVVGLAAAG